MMGAKQRSGDVVVYPVQQTDRVTMTQFVLDIVQQGAVVYTDEHKGFDELHRHFAHGQVRQKAREYVRDEVHTNGIESFWAVLRRGYYGTYHFMSPKHLHRFCNEYGGYAIRMIHWSMSP